jgi:hypothetical protein
MVSVVLSRCNENIKRVDSQNRFIIICFFSKFTPYFIEYHICLLVFEAGIGRKQAKNIHVTVCVR